MQSLVIPSLNDPNRPDYSGSQRCSTELLYTRKRKLLRYILQDKNSTRWQAKQWVYMLRQTYIELERRRIATAQLVNMCNAMVHVPLEHDPLVVQYD